jgi:hypothetical protein
VTARRAALALAVLLLAAAAALAGLVGWACAVADDCR